MNAASRVSVPARALTSAGEPVANDVAVIHGGKPVELLGFLHIGGRDKDTHLRTPLTDAIDQFPELAARQGSTPVVGSSRMTRSGSWISALHKETFCFMPPESLPVGRSGNGSRPVLRKGHRYGPCVRRPADRTIGQ